MTYHILLLISYLGLAIGTIIAYKTKEELKTGKKYFWIAQQLIFGMLFFFFICQLRLHVVISIVLTLLAVIFIFLWKRSMPSVNTDVYFYGLYPIILFETHKSNNAMIVTLLIFVFGLITAGSQYKEKLNLLYNFKSMLIQYVIYPIVGLLVATLRPYVQF